MQKARILLVLGVWITILPYLGFPYSWQDALTALTGLVFICLSYFLYKNYKATEYKEKTFDNFKENDDFNLAEKEADGEQVELNSPISETISKTENQEEEI
jgi:cbb3-type cytochrome oxidase subunit 3